MPPAAPWSAGRGLTGSEHGWASHPCSGPLLRSTDIKVALTAEENPDYPEAEARPENHPVHRDHQEEDRLHLDRLDRPVHPVHPGSGPDHRDHPDVAAAS